MSIHKDNATGKWRVVYRYTDWTGETHQSSKRGFPTKREAQMWERELLLKKEAKLDMTFESFYEIYVEDMQNRIRDNTWGTKTNIARTKILPYFGKRKIGEIEPRDIIAWQNELLAIRQPNGKPYSASYLQKIHSQLSAIFNHAVNFYHLPSNPAQKAGNMGKEEHREMLFWTKEEYLKFADAMMDKPVFLTESLIERENHIILAAKKEYKYRSVVSTPVEIVKYMVKNTLTPICEEKTPDEIKKIQIADIACGSGIFLEEAYQFLVDYCTEWYMQNDPEHLLELSNGKKKLPLTDKKDILTKCIYGVDIDVHAVEVSKFSLLIKLIEDETPASVKECVPILPDLSSNIKNGNSLICREDIHGKELPIEVLCNIKPFEWETINGGAKFDAIVGNPPYVKTEDIHTLETEEEFAVYKKKYKSAYKQFDKYFLFLEKAFDLLKEDGQMCYIVPNKFYKIGAGQELRRITAKYVSKLDDFGDMQLFPDKTIYSCIITLCNT